MTRLKIWNIFWLKFHRIPALRKVSLEQFATWWIRVITPCALCLQEVANPWFSTLLHCFNPCLSLLSHPPIFWLMTKSEICGKYTTWIAYRILDLQRKMTSAPIKYLQTSIIWHLQHSKTETCLLRSGTSITASKPSEDLKNDTLTVRYCLTSYWMKFTVSQTGDMISDLSTLCCPNS